MRSVLLTLALSALLCSGAQANTIQVDLEFDAPTMTSIDGATRIDASDCTPLGQPGNPLLPAREAVILLPPGEEITSVRIITSGGAVLTNPAPLVHAQTPRPISLGPGPDTDANTEIYGSDETFPAEAAKLVTVQRAWGHELAFFRVTPFAYQALSGELAWFAQVTLEVETAPIPGADLNHIPMLRSDDHVLQRIAEKVMNPDDLSLYDRVSAARVGEARVEPGYYPYVIVTTDTYADAFEPLAAFESSRGLHAHIMTTSEINASYTGDDLQMRIRNFIIDAYENWGTLYVLLGGDYDVIPVRPLYVDAGGTVDNFPGDCYYEGLDGNWNTDGDSRWGEPGEYDLTGEVAVGRASISNVVELNNWMHKNALYTEAPVVSEVKKALFVGESLDSSTWGGDSMDEVKDYTTTHGYTTSGYPGNYTKQTLYERTGNWSKYDVIDLFNAGHASSHHLGHSNTTYNMKMENPDVNLMTANGVTHTYSFISSQGCISCNFDNNSTDCIGEAFFYNEFGAVAYLGNTRYGWYMPGATSGPSQHFDRQLVDALYDEGIHTVGWMNVDSKVDCIWMLDAWMLWCHYELCLLGDPAMPQWVDVYGSLTLNHSGVYLMGSGEYEVTVLSGASPIAGAAVTVYSDDLQIWVSGTTDGNGAVVLDLGSPEPMTLNLKAVKADYLPVTGAVEVVPPSGPFLVVADVLCNDAGGDGVIDAGEAVLMRVQLNNVGVETATNVSASISCTSPHITLTTDTQTYPDIAPGASAWSNGFYAFDVAVGCPDLHAFELPMLITGEGRITWEAMINLTAHAPIITILSIEIDDTVGGDGNYRLDPGEDADVAISLHNAGTGRLNDITGVFSISHPQITITSGTGAISGLSQNESGLLEPIFGVSVSAYFGAFSGVFDLQLTGENSFAQAHELTLPIGGFYETVEAGAGDWTHSAVSGGFTDQWHVSTQRNHTPGGSQSWKCGDTGSGDYGNLLDAGLVTPAVEIDGEGELRFWMWIEAEESSSHQGRAYDGGLVELSIDGGPFVQITPEGGYTHTIRTGGTPGPFPEDTPVFSGSHNWQEVLFDLGEASGEVAFRFRFGSDGADTREGWYIDDIEVLGLAALSGVDNDLRQPARLTLLPSRPNPTAGPTHFSFALPQTGAASLAMYDATGRLVRTLINGPLAAGLHRADWDGMNNQGSPASSGLYYCRLQANGTIVQRAVVLTR